jgi:hypothetical protein
LVKNVWVPQEGTGPENQTEKIVESERRDNMQATRGIEGKPNGGGRLGPTGNGVLQ